MTHQPVLRVAGVLIALLLPFYGICESREVKINEGVSLAGTLSLPQGQPKAAIVFLTGSGAQDRDETIGKHKPFRVISDSLVNHGYATLRLDDRGAGESQGDASQTTLETEALDAATAIAWCQSLPELRNVPIGVFGHSQGGAVAIMLGGSGSYFPLPQFMVTYGAPLIKGTDMMMAQVQTLLEAQGQGAAWPQMAPILSKRYEMVASDLPADSLKAFLRTDVLATVPEQLQTPQFLERVDKEIEAMVSVPYRSLLRYNPTDWFEYIQVPWLALYGANDTQVPPKANKLPAALTTKLDNRTTLRVLPGLNHLGQETENGLPALYETIEQTVSPTLTNELVRWLDANIGRR